MKIYSYISALLIAGIASFSSCSQEEDVKEMNGDNSSRGLQISVSDGGYFDTTPGTRAIERICYRVYRRRRDWYFWSGR